MMRAADRGLDRDLEEVLRDQLLQLLAHDAAAAVGARAVDDQRQRIDRLGVDQDRHLDEVAGLIADHLVVERGIAAADRFEAVVEIEHHLVERQLVDEHGARARIRQLLLTPAPVLAQLEDAAEIFVRHHDGRLDPRLLDALDLGRIRHVGRVVHLDHRAVVHVEVVDDARRRGDQIEIEFAVEALGDDLKMQQAEKAAAEAEAERGGGFHLEGEARVVEAQPAHGGAQIFEVGGIDREQAAEHHRLRRLEAGQRLRSSASSRR